MERDMSARMMQRRLLDRAMAMVIVAMPCLVVAPVHAQGTVLTASDPKTADGEPEDLDEDEPAVLQPAPLSVCQTDLRLSGTFQNSQFPYKSFATFHVRADHPGGEVYRLGERVGAYAILSIESRSVVLDDGGAGCYLKLAGAPPPAPQAPPAKKHSRKKKRGDKAKEEKAEKPPEPPKPDFTAEELSKLVRSLGGDKYEIKKELLPKIAERSASLRSSTQYSSVRGYSGVSGLRLDKLASEGVLERLGLRTGDTVKTLNGLQLTSIEGALEAQKLMSSAPRLSLLIQRDGSPVTLEYQVVP
jgi:type II secretory pathway component PulC